jgi:hypothetical protein
MCRHLEKRIDFGKEAHANTVEAPYCRLGDRHRFAQPRHQPPPKTSPLQFLLSPLSAAGRASAGWWKRPGVARLPVRNKTPPPSRGLVNQIVRLVRGAAARVPPLPHNDVGSTNRVSLWERDGVRATTPRACGQTNRVCPSAGPPITNHRSPGPPTTSASNALKGLQT